ncbi:hypothetical protein C8R43DRAFT_71811 [Mycena crocata]|nr:hypothetical protein C8R43DRAFT_71811 [Mycena crocata]
MAGTRAITTRNTTTISRTPPMVTPMVTLFAIMAIETMVMAITAMVMPITTAMETTQGTPHLFPSLHLHHLAGEHRHPLRPLQNPHRSILLPSLSAQPNSVPPGQRKLLIFDLNGTLLLRSARNHAVRKIYLRPYAHALVAYIAHPAVQAWLDCMVWSSAQPHNVSEMVDRVFGAGEGAGLGPILRAVWARDTLGLGREAFHQKVQTTKDLAKPWAFFSPRTDVYTPTGDGGGDGSTCCHPWDPPPPSKSPPPTSLIQPILHWPPRPAAEGPFAAAPTTESTWPASGWSSAEPSATSDSLADTSPLSHGPHTTLLVDDSPLKARLQPWNHLCVAEYDAPTRARDRAAAGLAPDTDPSSAYPTRRRDRTTVHPSAHAGPPSGLAASAASAYPSTSTSSAPAIENGAEEALNADLNDDTVPAKKKERWRKRKRAEAEAQAEAVGKELAMLLEEAAEAGVDISTSSASTDDAQSGDLSMNGAVAVQGVSKRARRKQRKRLRQEKGLARGEPQMAASASSSPSLSPALLPAVANADVKAAHDESSGLLKAEGMEDASGIESLVKSDETAAAEAPSNRKRKREVDGENEEGELEQDLRDAVNTVVLPKAEASTSALETEPATSSPAAEADTNGEPYDPTLLAVVGVLSHVRTVGNVAAWVRSGGLAVASEADTKVEEAGAVSDKEMKDGADGDVNGLPSDPNQWFTSRRLLNAWAARGRAALAELGIDATPGVE